MKYNELRRELTAYYRNTADARAAEFCRYCEEELNAAFTPQMNPMEMKMLQYEVISGRMEPVVFGSCPFYYETGTMAAHCDGAGELRGHFHAGGWTYRKNQHRFPEQDPELWKLRQAQGNALFYLICGPYNDNSQHFGFFHRPIMEKGLCGIYDAAQMQMNAAENAREKQYLEATCRGLLAVKRMAEKFAIKAENMLLQETEPDKRKNLRRIAETAGRVPWEKPETFYEALNTYAFMRKAVGTLEGVGVNTFGRLDMDLESFYLRDLAAGRITEDEAYDLIAQFLVTFDLHYDHDMKMVGYADHELENTYVLGGCDREGEPFCNALTMMFLRANREEKIIYPKIKCRFSANSPKAYLDEINGPILKGTSTVLYMNDDAVIPALIRAGYTVQEARDYIVTGCWGLHCQGTEKIDGGAYVNILKALEYSVHRMEREMDEVGMHFLPLDEAESFEEVYRITCENCRTLFRERARITRLGGNICNQVNSLPIFSSTLQNCIESRRDYYDGGAKYRNDHYKITGFANVTDSLLAIRELCFEQRKYSLSAFLHAVRTNWDGQEVMRRDAMACHGWGDGSRESCEFAAKFHLALAGMLEELVGTYGGKVFLGYLNYTEVRWWGEQTKATPDGRMDGDYYAQGLTPSRLKKIRSVTDVIASLRALDRTVMAGNSVVNIILPSGSTTPEVCESFLRAAADSSMQTLQLNCTSKETLLDAQKYPDKYPELIVRVTGFSAKFTSLSPGWQEEVISRNFYE